MTLSEIQQAVTQLSKEDLSRFRAWFDEFMRDSIDLPIIEERRNESGRPLRDYLHKPKFGSAKGKFKFAKDSDEPLEDFSKYMP
ncbi:MAG: DUF2281 domain-containing protein [Anaerolineales bacterium]